MRGTPSGAGHERLCSEELVLVRLGGLEPMKLTCAVHPIASLLFAVSVGDGKPRTVVVVQNRTLATLLYSFGATGLWIWMVVWFHEKSSLNATYHILKDVSRGIDGVRPNRC
jgi:hypothetical protein